MEFDKNPSVSLENKTKDVIREERERKLQEAETQRKQLEIQLRKEREEKERLEKERIAREFEQKWQIVPVLPQQKHRQIL